MLPHIIRAFTLILTVALSTASVRAATYYVNLQATGLQDGTSWADAFTSIGDALSNVADGDEVWVAAGTYKENLVSANGTGLRSGVRLLGGFAGTETSESERNPAVNLTSIDGRQKGSVIELEYGAGPGTQLDGFRLRGGRDDNGGAGGGGIYVNNNVTGTISNNVITENRATQGAGIVVQYGSPTIVNNLIFDNEGYAPGILAYNGATKIINNTIVNNHYPEYSVMGAVALFGQTGAVVANNIIKSNDVGIQISTSTVTIKNNDVVGNVNTNYSGITDQTGLNGNLSSDPLFVNEGGGSFRLPYGSPALDTGDTASAVGPVDLDFTARLQGDEVDMGAYENGITDLHLVFTTQPGGGLPDEVWLVQPVVQVCDQDGAPVTSYSGQVTVVVDPGSAGPLVEVQGTTTVDVVDGVAEFTDLWLSGNGTGVVLNATIPDGLPAQSKMFDVGMMRIHVSTTGSDSNSGASWAEAKQTVQAAVDAAGEGTEIWVAEGTYHENISVNQAVALYGGFDGTETDIYARDVSSHPTILDGGNTDRVLTSGSESVIQVIDGFTFQNGYAGGGSGGAVYLYNFNGSISNSIFQNNHADNEGGGVYIYTAGQAETVSIMLENVAFNSNSSSSGGGLYVDTGSGNQAEETVLSICTFSGNTAFRGGGAHLRGTVRMEYCQFTDNTAVLGGGVYHNGNAQSNGTTFTGNGIVNSSEDAAGGAWYSEGFSFVFAGENIIASNNVSAVSGKKAVGGAWAALEGAFLQLDDSTVSGNTAGEGGALFSSRSRGFSMSRSRVFDNVTTGNGGAIYVNQGTVRMISSLLTGNQAGGSGGALYLLTSPEIRDQYSEVVLINNTISANTATGGGAAIDNRQYGSMTLVNNIIAFNGSGIRQDATSNALFLNNNIHGNGVNTDGLPSPVGVYGNIDADPLFVNKAAGDYRLTAGSPSVDAGDSGRLIHWDRDLDVQQRLQGPAVDMGAYERSATSSLFLQFDNNGFTADAPGVLPVQPVVRVIDRFGGTQTSYSGSVTVSLRPETGTAGAVLGGTVTVPVVNGLATFTNLSVDRGGTGYVLKAVIPGMNGLDSQQFTVKTPLVRVSTAGSDANDGGSWGQSKRTLQAALSQVAQGGSVWVQAGTYHGLSRLTGEINLLGGFSGIETSENQRNPKTNIVTLNGIAAGSILSVDGAAADTAWIDGFTFTNGTDYGGGIIVYDAAPLISNNVFTGNNATFGGGILAFSSAGRIERNRFTGNSVTYSGGGVYISSGSMTLDSNVFSQNTEYFQDGSAITVYGGNQLLTNNTFANNTGDRGVISFQNGNGTLKNNIIAFNEAGITKAVAGATVVMEKNNVYSNTGFNYQNITPGATDISASPLFVSYVTDDFHLTAGSPCIDAGDDSVVLPGALDLDGFARIQGAHVDMGAYEAGVSGGFTTEDVRNALRISLGALQAGTADVTRLNVVNDGGSAGRIDLRDAGLLARKVFGLESNP